MRPGCQEKKKGKRIVGLLQKNHNSEVSIGRHQLTTCFLAKNYIHTPFTLNSSAKNAQRSAFVASTLSSRRETNIGAMKHLHFIDKGCTKASIL